MAIKKIKKLLKDPLLFIADSPFMEGAIKRSTKYKNLNTSALKLYKSNIPALQKNSITPPQNVKEPTFNSAPLNSLDSLKDGEKAFIYLPWIKLHGDKLIKAIKTQCEKDNVAPKIHALDLFKDIEVVENRRTASRYSRYDVIGYRKKLLDVITPYKDKISALIVTFDWHPVMRTLVRVARELGIPTIAILHESVFMDEAIYYKDLVSDVDHPICDKIFCWGDLQRSIFLHRGVPEEKIQAIGAVKFDTHINYKPTMPEDEFRKTFGIEENHKVLLYTAQPMDSYSNVHVAREAQNQAIQDIYEYTKNKDIHLLIRMPPSGDDILSPATIDIANENKNVSIDSTIHNTISPEDAIYHADIVLSINSTMLLEAQLMNRPSISTKYLAFKQIWQEVGIPHASDKEALHREIKSALKARQRNCSAKGYKKAAEMFSNGTFDGKTCERIIEELKKIEKDNNSLRSDIKDSIINGDDNITPITALGIINQNNARTFQKYVPNILNAKRNVGVRTTLDTYPADIILQWGQKDSSSFRATNARAEELGLPKLILEDGFIRSLDLGIKNQPTLSIIIDKYTSYYDAYTKSYLEECIETSPELNKEQLQQAQVLIRKIVENKISKYDHAPIQKLNIGSSDAKKVLLIDQRFGDQSVKSGMMDGDDYYKMLDNALADNPGYDIIIKRHPDANSGLKQSYYHSEKLKKYQKHSNIYFIDYDINIYSVLDEVEKVYVGTSGAGFEALMAGKEVHCYGVPFYANWGLTHDKKDCGRRTNKASLEKVFYYAYVALSKYYQPDLQRRCSLNELCDYIIENRNIPSASEEENQYFSIYNNLPKSERKSIKAARLLRLIGKFDEARELLQELLKENPNKIEALQELHVLNEYSELKPRFRNHAKSGFALQKCAALHNIETVLDVGAGAGEHSSFFSQLGKKVTALDLGKSIYYEQKNNNVDFVVSDFFDYDTSNKFDLVWASHVLEHQPNPNLFLKKALEHTKPGGWVAITIPPLKHNIVGGHVSLWNAGLLAYQLILAGFDCSNAQIIQYGYNISAIVQKPQKPIEIPELSFDSGDIEKLKHFFPKDWTVHEGFDGTLGRQFIPHRF